MLSVWVFGVLVHLYWKESFQRLLIFQLAQEIHVCAHLKGQPCRRTYIEKRVGSFWNRVQRQFCEGEVMKGRGCSLPASLAQPVTGTMTAVCTYVCQDHFLKCSEWLVLSSEVGDIYLFKEARIYWCKLPGNTFKSSRCAITCFDIFDTFLWWQWGIIPPRITGGWERYHKVLVLILSASHCSLCYTE